MRVWTNIITLFILLLVISKYKQSNETDLSEYGIRAACAFVLFGRVGVIRSVAVDWIDHVEMYVSHERRRAVGVAEFDGHMGE